MATFYFSLYMDFWDEFSSRFSRASFSIFNKVSQQVLKLQFYIKREFSRVLLLNFSKEIFFEFSTFNLSTFLTQA